jgi:hypothetical protein
MKVINKLLTHREQQFNELQRGMAKCGKKIGDVTTVNLTAIKVLYRRLISIILEFREN